MVIKVNITELESKAKYASSLAKQLKWKADEINDLYYSLDSEVKNRNGIGQSMVTLQRKIERAQQRMYNISEFLSSAAERYHKAETLVVAKSRNIGMVSAGSTISRDFGTVGAATVGATTALEDRNIDTNTGAVKGKGEGKKWYQSNFFKLAVGVVVVGGAIALACTVGGPILVGMAVGAATGAAYGGLLGGVSSYISGGDFMNGFSDGFMWGGISGAISGAVSAKGIGMLGTAFADGAVDSAIYVGETKLNGGNVSAMGVMSSFAMGMGISYWGSSRAMKRSKRASNDEKQLLNASEWNEYFKKTYGSENVEWVTENKASFGSRNLLEGHFDRHGSEFGGIYNSADEYLQGAKDVMNNGYKVKYDYNVTDKWGMKVPEQRTGYMRFMGNNRKGEAKFEFVGTNNRGDITTYHTESGKTLWKLLNGSNIDKTINPVK